MKTGAARAHAELFPEHRFVAIEAAGHSPMEEKPMQFVEAVTAFLADVESSQVAGDLTL